MPYYRYRPRRRSSAGTALAIGAGLFLALGMRGHHGLRLPSIGDEAGSPRGAQVAISYAEHQLGCPYYYGGTGPCSSGFDCSGLMMQAWAAAGVQIERTSQEQWLTLPHVSRLAPGDLIFYAGSDGTQSSPGHVVMYIGHGKVIQAYATGYPIEITPLSQMDAGALTGYARP